MYKPLPHQRVRYKNHTYRVVEYGLGKINGKWTDVVHYRRIVDDTGLDDPDHPLYTRELNDFLDSFEAEDYLPAVAG